MTNREWGVRRLMEKTTLNFHFDYLIIANFDQAGVISPSLVVFYISGVCFVELPLHLCSVCSDDLQVRMQNCAVVEEGGGQRTDPGPVAVDDAAVCVEGRPHVVHHDLRGAAPL